MQKTVTALTAALLIWGATADPAVAAACDTPLPDDVQIMPPASDVPADLARFSGAWGDGKWGGQLCNTLVVEMVAADGVIDAIYSWGESRGWSAEPGFSRVSARVADGKFSFAAPGGAEVTYWVSGRYVRGAYMHGMLDARITLVEKDISASSRGAFMN